jgi:hypothetical protein
LKKLENAAKADMKKETAPALDSIISATSAEAEKEVAQESGRNTNGFDEPIMQDHAEGL